MRSTNLIVTKRLDPVTQAMFALTSPAHYARYFDRSMHGNKLFLLAVQFDYRAVACYCRDKLRCQLDDNNSVCCDRDFNALTSCDNRLAEVKSVAIYFATRSFGTSCSKARSASGSRLLAPRIINSRLKVKMSH